MKIYDLSKTVRTFNGNSRAMIWFKNSVWVISQRQHPLVSSSLIFIMLQWYYSLKPSQYTFIICKDSNWYLLTDRKLLLCDSGCQLLDTYKDVFTDKISKGLSPERQREYHFNQALGGTKQRKDMYRISTVGLEELRTKIEGPLELGLYCRKDRLSTYNYLGDLGCSLEIDR